MGTPPSRNESSSNTNESATGGGSLTSSSSTSEKDEPDDRPLQDKKHTSSIKIKNKLRSKKKFPHSLKQSLSCFDLEISACMAKALKSNPDDGYTSPGSELSSYSSTSSMVSTNSLSSAGTSPASAGHGQFTQAPAKSLPPILERSVESTPEPPSEKFRNLSLLSKKFKPQNEDSESVDLDAIIESLIETGLSRSYTRKLCVRTHEIKHICSKARELFLAQPSMLELAAPVKVVGDIHGQFYDLLRILKLSGFPPHSNYLFLGDFVDRGKQSLETILLLLCFKIKYPENFFMLRGNHESANITKIYGFYDECKRRSSVKIWKNFIDVFNTLPIAATIGNKIFCIHGGLSPHLKNLDQIKNIKRPTDIPEKGLLSDLLWSDPDGSAQQEWSENDRGVSFCFSKKVVAKFCERFNFDLIIRGHMVVEEGYEFFAKRKLVTLFSAPNYCGEFDNWGAVMNVNKRLLCSFELLKPAGYKKG